MNPKSQMTFKFGLGVAAAEMILVVLESREVMTLEDQEKEHTCVRFLLPLIF